MRTKMVALDELAEDPRNAREHGERNVKAIAESLERFGQRRPLVVMPDGTVIAGNGTLRAMRALGWKRVAVTEVPADWTAEQARAFAIADNRTAELAHWNEVAVVEQVTELEAAGFEPAALGFTARELGAMRTTNGQGEPKPEAEIPDPPAEPITKVGDTWQLGDHRVVCGDTFEADTIARLLGDVVPAMVATDPPYAIYGSSTGIGEDIADDRMVRPFFEATLRLFLDRLPWFGHAYVSCDWRSWAAIWEAARRVGMPARNLIVWDKGGQGLGSNYANTYELVGFFVKLPPPTAMGSRPTGQRAVHRPNLFHFPRPAGAERLHNAAKPVALYGELIENSSDEGAAVLDPFAGSGSTLIAASERGRRCFAVDVEPKWVDVMVERWQQATGGKAKRVSS